MADTLTIVRGISQALANKHDGALDENGDPVLIGLRREEGLDITDRRVMDGFNVSLYGDKLCIKYHCEMPLKEVHDKNMESNVEQTVADIVKYLKKEYRKATKESLNIVKEGEVDILVQSASRVRSWIQAKCEYVIKNYEDVEPLYQESDEKRVDTAIKTFLDKGGMDSKTKNDKRPAPEKLTM